MLVREGAKNTLRGYVFARPLAAHIPPTHTHFWSSVSPPIFWSSISIPPKNFQIDLRTPKIFQVGLHPLQKFPSWSIPPPPQKK